MATRASVLPRLESMPSQAAVVQYALEPLAVELREVAVPEIGDDDVLLQVGAVSVCGSDVHQVHATRTRGRSTSRSCSATSSAARSRRPGARVRGFREGDRVVSETAAHDLRRRACCAAPAATTSARRARVSATASTARWRTSCACRRAACIAIPDSLPFDLACLAEPHAVAYQAMCVNSTIRPGDSVVVLGPGPIGLLCARMAALSGADPLIVAGLTADAPRLEAARAAWRDAHRERADAEPRGSRARPRSRSAPTWSATRRARAGRSRTRSAGAPGRPGHEGRLVAGQRSPVDMNPLVQQERARSRDRSATTIRCGSASSTCSIAG